MGRKVVTHNSKSDLPLVKASEIVIYEIVMEISFYNSVLVCSSQ